MDFGVSKTNAWVTFKMSAIYIHLFFAKRNRKNEVKTLLTYKMIEKIEGSFLEHNVVRIKVEQLFIRK